MIFMLGASINGYLCQIHVPRANCQSCGASDLLMCPKTACYQNAMNITLKTKASNMKDILRQQMVGASGDWHCMQLIKDADDPVQAALAIHQTSVITTPPEPPNTRPKITSDCKHFNCAVLKTAIEHPDLVWAPKSEYAGACRNSQGSKQPADASSCVCAGLYQTMDATKIANIEAMCDYTFPSTITTTTTITGGAAGGATSRLLTAGGTVIPTDSTPELNCDHPDGCDASAKADMMQGTADKVHLLPSIASENIGRQLNHIPPTQAPVADLKINEGLPEFTVGEWSLCTCYQACQEGVFMPGISTRRVQCMSPKCKAPTPQVSKTCFCQPCADCRMSLHMQIVNIAVALQCFLCLVMWLSMMYMSSVPEAELVSLSWGQAFLGCFVSQMPLLIRLIVIFNLGYAIFFVFVTFFPKNLIAYQNDCPNVPALRVHSVLFQSLIIAMIIAGVLIKHSKRMDPYLFRPVRGRPPAPIRLLGKFIRCLGP